MEELQSTEVLDREILEDARKKAYRILKNAEESVKAGVEVWELKTDEAIAEVRERYARRGLIVKDELAARLILDKRRVQAQKIEGLLKSAMETYLFSLNRETLLSILEYAFRQRLDFLRKTQEFVESELQIQSHKIHDAELKEMLNRNLPQGSWTLGSENNGLKENQFPAIVVNAPTIRIVISIDAIADNLMEDKRAELASTLLGEKVLLEGGSI
ncbi:MAG: ATPase [Treponema sp.]|jgi:hypothetical protein|nr:ATPase [Treponema sp.]